MKTPALKRTAKLAFVITIVSILIISCKKDLAVDNKSVQDQPAPKKLDTVYYQWGELSINRGIITDIISYNNNGKITSITSTNGSLYPISIIFTYQGNQLSLNTATKDIYTMDNSGKVISHQSTEVQNNMTFVHTEDYNYDSNGYISSIAMKLNGTAYSTINYKVQNGNYTSYILSNTSDGAITRQYDFIYGTEKVNSAFAFFTPIFGDNTYVAVEKYLNFGKQSVNVISAINYTIGTEGGGPPVSGTLTAGSSFDAEGNLTDLDLTAASPIYGFPLDNLSPLPRYVKFAYSR
jgi:hypothetical protein